MTLQTVEQNTVAIQDKIQAELTTMKNNIVKYECEHFVYKELVPINTYEDLNTYLAYIDKEIANRQKFVDNAEGFAKKMEEDELKPIIRNKQIILDLQQRIKDASTELEFKYYQPTEYAIKEISNYINDSHQELLDFIFNEFVNRIVQMCPKDQDYKQTITSIYENRNSQKVISIFETLRCNLIDAFTKLIKVCDKPLELLNRLKVPYVFNIYANIEGDIDKLFKLQPDKVMSDSRLVKSYSQTLLSTLHQFIINKLKDSIYEQLQNMFIELGILKSPDIARSETEQKQTKCIIVEEVEEVEEVKEQQTPTIDGFINSLPINKPILSDELLVVYNRFMGTNINKTSLGITLKNNQNIKSERKTVNKVKSTFYKRIG